MKKIFIVVSIFLIFSVTNAQEKIWAKVFFDYSYNKDAAPNNEFEIHRAYFTYQNQITESISYKFTTDVGRTTKDDRLTAYLKNALIKWKTKFGSFVFGLQGMNVFKIQEGNWGYRFLEKSPMDQYEFASSADLGIGYYNKLGGKINFGLTLTNGTGYKHSENDQYKKISANIYYGSDKLDKSGKYNYGAIITQETYDFTSGSIMSAKSKMVYGVFGAFQLMKLRLGAEFDMRTIGGPETKNMIISAYANYALYSKLDIFARFDNYDPNTDLADDANIYVIAGVDYKPGKGLYIAPNIRYVKPEAGSAQTIFKLNFQFKI